MRPESNLALVLTVLASFLSLDGAEGQDIRDPGGVERWDSAGVEVVESNESVWEEREEWAIEPEPLLEIGVVAGEEPYEFSSINDAARLPDGRIAIVDRGTREIRVFDEEGGHLATLGGAGEGPGEFQDRPAIQVISPDTILAWDPTAYRLSWFSPHEGLLDDEALFEVIDEIGIVRAHGGAIWDVAVDGTLLARHQGRERTGPDRSEYRMAPTLVRDGGEQVHRLDEFTVTEMYDVNGGILSRPFPPDPHVEMAPDGSHLAVVKGGEWAVEIFDGEGEPLRAVRAAVPREEVTDELLEAERDRIVEGFRLRPGQVAEAWDEVGIPDRLPAIGDLQWASDGHLWVGRRSAEDGEPPEYDVIDPEGRWLGTVTLPEGLGSIHEIGEDYLLATWTDDLDVQYLRKHRLRRP